MRRLSFLVTGLVLGWLACAAVAPAADRRPNILILLADDYGYADVGFQGCKDIPTPNLDSIARGGVRCSSGYVSGVYCSPTRAGLLTGRYQQRFGHEFNPGAGSGSEDGLPLQEVTLADRLKAAGYATGLVGKWHLGEQEKFHPLNRGFTEFFGFLPGAHSYFEADDKTRGPIYRGRQPVAEKEYLTDAFGREAVAFIDRHQKEPFFLFLSFNAVHTPMQATEKDLQRFPKLDDTRRHTYAAMTAAMDDAVGAVLGKLRSSGLEENTLIFFFSDNGGPTSAAPKGTTTNGSRNDPLRGSKRTTLEGGIRVPFAIQWKGKLPAGKVYEQPVIQLDILPTALAAAGVEVKPEWKLDGVNLLPFLEGKDSKPPHETLYWRMGGQMAIRKGDWKLVRCDWEGKLSGVELYNLADDIGEKNNRAAKQPETVKELEAAWKQWDAQLAQPLWGDDRKR